MPAYDNISTISGSEGTVYLVLDDFGRFGRAWRETHESEARSADYRRQSAVRSVRTSAQDRRLQCRRGLGSRRYGRDCRRDQRTHLR